MNADRRHTAQVCIELIKECAEVGEMSEASHVALTAAVKHLQFQEYWQIKNQEKHAGSNPSTDKQISISRVALPALELAVEALVNEDYNTVLDQLVLASTTDGEVAKKTSKKNLRRVAV